MNSSSAAPSAIDWEELRQLAILMTTRAYAPYSNFSVGAAAVTTTGSIVSGANVENVSYGLTLCAECGLVSDLVAHGAGKLTGVVVVSGSGEHCAPCGRCRQLLVEHAAPGALIDTAGGPHPLIELLPGHFDASRLKDG